MTNLTIKGKFDRNYVESAVLEVYLKCGIPKNVEQILVIDHPKYYKVIEPKIPRAARKEFRQAYQNDPTSMSLTYGIFDLVIISISLKEERYLKTNKKALIGLVAHELMHIKQRRKDLDRSIRADAIRAFSKFEPRLRNLKIPQKIIADFYAAIGESANYTLKDIYDNFELIDIGMGEYILEDYWNLYTYSNSFAKPTFYSSKDTPYKLIEHVRGAIDFELNLISAIAPFVKMARAGNQRARKLVNYIEKNYEVNISEVANAYDDVIQYAIDHLAWTGAFRKKYFTIVFKRALYLLNNLELEYEGLKLEKTRKLSAKSSQLRAREKDIVVKQKKRKNGKKK